MHKSSISIGVDSVLYDSTPLIILRETGIFYTAQCGGVSCTHPTAEGFVVSLGNFAQDFNDCAFGCQYISRDPVAQLKLAKAFDEYCIKEMQGMRFEIRFDFERINELQEGWIPVIINGFLSDCDVEFSNAKGIIHNGNCD